jgi:hypothetical protein
VRAIEQYFSDEPQKVVIIEGPPVDKGQPTTTTKQGESSDED